MNILILSRHEPVPFICGVERVSQMLLRAFKRDGHNVFSLVHVKYKYELPDDLKIDYFPTEDSKDPVNEVYLREYVKKNNIDIIINQYGTAWTESKLFLSCKDAKLITVIHTNPRQQLDYYANYLKTSGGIRKSLFPFIPLLKWRYYRVINGLYEFHVRTNNAVVLLSDKFKNFKCLKSKNVISIPNAIDKLANEKLNPQAKEKTILYVGRLERTQKQPQELIKAFKIVEERHPDWQLKMVGDGPDRQLMIDLANKLNIKNISFTGFIDPFPEFEKASINCLTSIVEGFGLTITEGMAHKCVPVVYNSFPVASEIIDDGVSGLLVSKGNHKEMAEKICWLIEHPDERCHMAEAAYAKVRDNYYIDNVVKRWYALFDRLMKERKNA